MFSERTTSRPVAFAWTTPSPARTFVIALFAADVLFIAIHAILRLLEASGSGLDLEVFDIEHDGSLPEVFNYLKVGLVVVLLAVVSCRTRSTPFLVLALCFATALLDDSLGLHEQLGSYLSGRLRLSPVVGVGSRHLGELLVFVAVGGIFASALFIGWRHVDDDLRPGYVRFVALLGAVGFFAAIVDVLHQVVFSFSRVGSGVVGLIEDGGEMLVITLTIATAIRFVSRPGHEDEVRRLEASG